MSKNKILLLALKHGGNLFEKRRFFFHRLESSDKDGENGTEGMELNLKLDRYSASRIIQISSNHLRNHPTRISPDFNLKSKTQPVGNSEKDHVTASIRFRFRG